MVRVIQCDLFVRLDVPLCRWYDLGWSFRVKTRSEGEGPDSPSRGRGVRISRGERSPWGNGASVREPSGLDEPRRIEPGRGRTDRGAWWSRPWSRGGCWSVGIREFPIPTANSAPFWITAGPDASLYFTAGGTNQIGAYNPATHGFTSFLIPTATVGSSSYITAGTDGNLYFTDSQDNAIEQLNPATHVITSFPIPTAGIGPQFITTGPDGNLYFTASNANVIEQLDPTTRVFTTFFIPTANSGASGITSGPDNSLWFIESAANKIGQLNPATGVYHGIAHPDHGRRHLHDHDRAPTVISTSPNRARTASGSSTRPPVPSGRCRSRWPIAIPPTSRPVLTATSTSPSPASTKSASSTRPRSSSRSS